MLPDLSLPFDLTLPRVVAAAGHWFWHSLLPGVGTAILLPLVWLALTATVFGWQQRSARDLVAGTPIEGHATRVTERLSRRRHTASWRAGRRSLDILTADLRTKYLPVVDALRLVVRAGPRFLGAYLVLATLLATLQDIVRSADRCRHRPAERRRLARHRAHQRSGRDLVFTTLSVALYVAAVDRVFAEVSGRTRPARARSRAGAGT